MLDADGGASDVQVPCRARSTRRSARQHDRPRTRRSRRAHARDRRRAQHPGGRLDPQRHDRRDLRERQEALRQVQCRAGSRNADPCGADGDPAGGGGAALDRGVRRCAARAGPREDPRLGRRDGRVRPCARRPAGGGSRAVRARCGSARRARFRAGRTGGGCAAGVPRGVGGGRRRARGRPRRACRSWRGSRTAGPRSRAR